MSEAGSASGFLVAALSSAHENSNRIRSFELLFVAEDH